MHVEESCLVRRQQEMAALTAISVLTTLRIIPLNIGLLASPKASHTHVYKHK